MRILSCDLGFSAEQEAHPDPSRCPPRSSKASRVPAVSFGSEPAVSFTLLHLLSPRWDHEWSEAWRSQWRGAESEPKPSKWNQADTAPGKADPPSGWWLESVGSEETNGEIWRSDPQQVG